MADGQKKCDNTSITFAAYLCELLTGRDKRTTAKMTKQNMGNNVPIAFHSCLFGLFVFITCVSVSYTQLKNEVSQFDIVMAAPLAISAGCAWILFGLWLTRWQMTRSIGLTILGRINLRKNWVKHPVRSFAELGWWLGTVWGSHAVYNDMLIATQLGTFCGLVAVIIGDYLAPKIRSFQEESVLDSNRIESTSVIAISLVLGTFGFEIIKIFYLNHTNLILGIVLPSLAGIGFGLGGELCLTWRPTRNIGITLVQRVLQAPENWLERPIRSIFETTIWLTAVYGNYIAYGNLFLAIRLGVAVGITVVLLNSWLLKHFLNSDELKVLQEAAKIIFFEKKENLDTQLSFEEWQAANQDHTLYHELERKVKKERDNDQLRYYSLKEIAQHNTKQDCWISIGSDVYDVSDWLDKHPGGGEVILKFAGRDATDQFYAFHPHQATNLHKYLKFFKVGKVSDQNMKEYTKDYRDLRRYLWINGYFEPSISYFILKHVIIFGIVVAMFIFLFFAQMTYTTSSSHSSSILFTIAAALALALTWQQSAFLAHDALHIGALKTSEANHLLGWVHGSCIFGISPRKWVVEHSIHHACTLRPTQDPQFDYLPLWLQHKKEIPVSPFFTNKGKIKSWWMTSLIAVQHITYLPVSIFCGRFVLVAESVVYACRHLIWMDIIGMSIFWTTFFSILFYFVPSSIVHKIIFVLVSHFAIGILHVQLLISHLGTTMFTVEEEIAAQFFKTQLATSRNIETSSWSHWFHGGLEKQIEHHLFPLMPRHNLSKVVPFVRILCAKHSIPYQSIDFWQAIKHCTKDFKNTSRALLFPDL